MAWLDFDAGVEAIFRDAQSIQIERSRARGWDTHSRYVERHREAKKRHSLRALRSRMFHRGSIACKNPKCRVQFCPYNGHTRYCDDACRIRCLSLSAYYRRKARRPHEDRICPICGARVRRRIDAIYCSRRCNVRAVRKRAACASTKHTSAT